MQTTAEPPAPFPERRRGLACCARALAPLPAGYLLAVLWPNPGELLPGLAITWDRHQVRAPALLLAFMLLGAA